MAEQTRREALAAAWDKMDETEESDDVEVLDAPEGEVDATTTEVEDSTPDGDVSSSGSDTIVKDGKEKSGDKVEKESKKPTKDSSQTKEVEAANREPEVKDKPPNSWKPLARETWAKIPEGARAEINRRELEIQQTLSQTATVRKFANDFANAVAPYQHIIRQQNSTPLQAVQNLMQTAAGLMQGTQYQKAAIIAEILTNYGVDVKTLDDYLAANWNPGARPGQRPQQVQEQMPPWAQRIYGFIDSFEQKQQVEKERLKQTAESEIAKLESEPYFQDVQDDIADILQIAANKGISMTLKQAYEKACLLNDDVQKAIKAKRLENLGEKRKNSGTHITRARRAASTLSGAPQGKVSGKESGAKTRRQMLSEAWDSADS